MNVSVLTKTEKRLMDALRNIWDDKEFVIGVLTDLETDEERQIVMDHIESNDNVTSEEITLLSLFIDSERSK